MLSQIDSQGNHFLLIKEINEHYKYSSAINRANGFLISKSGNVHAKKDNKRLDFSSRVEGRILQMVALG